MIISKEKWDDIIAETRACIEHWNARATEKGCDDTFRCRLLPMPTRTTPTHVALMTVHESDGEHHTVVRELATGEVRCARAVIRENRVVAFWIKTPDPKAWDLLANKSTSEIVTKLKLIDFLLCLGSSVTAVRTVEGGRTS